MKKPASIRKSKKKLIRTPKRESNLANAEKDNSEVHFYRANEKPYGVFSNLFQRQIVFEGRKFPTAEHAYQAARPRRAAVQKWILAAPSPSLLAMAAHGLYTWEIAPDWAQIKYTRMRKVLRAKFSQHEDLRQVLLSTGDARLVEVGRVDSPVNRTWGEVNGKGQNMLGVLLMELRTELRTKSGKAKPKPKRRDGKSRSLHR